jgi:glycosyltransferase involved in cell wall biosynthesis
VHRGRTRELTPVRGIHQFVPMLHRGDAVGRHALRLRDLMAARGIPSRIYVELVDPETAAETEVASAYPAARSPGDVLLYQLATASDLAPWLAARAETLVVNYHNITPPEMFAAWDNGLARHQLKARAELALLAPRTTLAVAVSDYNQGELTAAGYARTTVVPPAAMMPAPATALNRSAPRRRGARWLSVGRMAPNKSLQDAAMALLVTRAHHDPEATLQIVGQSVVPAYTRALARFVADMGLGRAVTFHGHVSDDALTAALAQSDVLVVTSNHEGFGVPIIEAMSAGLPVVANRAGALPEVVGPAGVLVDTGDPFALAAAITDLLEDAGRTASLVAAGHAQVGALNLDTAGDRLIDLVQGLP